jgi:hypothetical protein
MIGAACPCPFYGAALFVAREPQAMVTSFPTMGNQCALITSAISPCWMEVAENAAPDWAQCPRNPEFLATLPADQNDGGRDRVVAHFRNLEQLTLARRGAGKPS